MKTTEEIYSELLAAFAERSGFTPTEGGDMSVRLYATAAQLYSLWLNQEFVLKQMFPQTACGEYLDMHARVRGVARRDAAAAYGFLRFYIDAPAAFDIAVFEGARCKTVSGEEFVTTAPGVIAAGSLCCDVPARAVVPGAAGNVSAGSIVSMTLAPAGVSGCVNPSAFSGGAEAEDDDSLRERIITSYKLMPNGANKAYYETQALNVGGVAAASVIPRARGVGTVDIYIAGTGGVPEDDTLSAVAELLNSQREICVDLQVMPPVPTVVNLSVALKAAEGEELDTVAAAVTERLTAYFDGKLLGKDILRADLGGIIYTTPGVKNYAISSPSADVTVGSGELPILGTLNITQMGQG